MGRCARRGIFPSRLRFRVNEQFPVIRDERFICADSALYPRNFLRTSVRNPSSVSHFQLRAARRFTRREKLLADGGETPVVCCCNCNRLPKRPCFVSRRRYWSGESEATGFLSCATSSTVGQKLHGARQHGKPESQMAPSCPGDISARSAGGWFSVPGSIRRRVAVTRIVQL